MKIHKVKSYEHKGDQHWQMVVSCRYHWYRLNKADYQSYQEIMNMNTYRINYKHRCYVALTYHFNLNKW